jgi:enoyl-[acyl-carrier-protein] reductase (NADH)
MSTLVLGISTFVIGVLVGWEFQSFAYGVAAWLSTTGAIVWLSVLYEEVKERVENYYRAKYEGGR